MNIDLKAQILDVIKTNSKRRFISAKFGRGFYADGISFSQICSELGESNAGLKRKREIKSEAEKLVSEDILIYIFGEPPVYILKNSIKYK